MAGIIGMYARNLYRKNHCILGIGACILQKIIGIDNYLVNIIRFGATLYMSCQLYRLQTLKINTGKMKSWYELFSVESIYSITCIGIGGVIFYNMGFLSTTFCINTGPKIFRWILDSIVEDLPMFAY
jgi:hypothetical protein